MYIPICSNMNQSQLLTFFFLLSYTQHTKVLKNVTNGFKGETNPYVSKTATELALAGWLSWLECHRPVLPKAVDSISSQGTYPGFRFDSLVGAHAGDKGSMFLSSAFLSLKAINISSGKDCKKQINKKEKTATELDVPQTRTYTGLTSKWKRFLLQCVLLCSTPGCIGVKCWVVSLYQLRCDL